MGKTKKSAKEIERLRNLYQSQGSVGSAPSLTAEVSSAPTSAPTESVVRPHAIVRKDLVFLTILIIVFAVLLFGINYLASTTALGDVLGNLVTKFI